MSKIFIILLMFLFPAGIAYSQAELPSFLQGTWKAKDNNIYEHWDKLNDKTMKGFSYTMDGEHVIVNEYLDISINEKQIIYTASVVSQNQGAGVEYKATVTAGDFVFENPAHDFPKKITYKKLSENEIFVQISDGQQKNFSFNMKRQNIMAAGLGSSSSNPNYDSVLAEKLGGDKYGMKSYIFIILKTGQNNSADTSFINECFRAHLGNIMRLAEEKKLVLAGPFVKNENKYRGIFILDNVTTLEEAREILQTDQAVKNGFLDVEIFRWYGSAALPVYLETDDKIWKEKP